MGHDRATRAHWMFALDRPVTASPGAILTPGAITCGAGSQSAKPRRYEVRSSLEMARQELQPRANENVSLEVLGVD